VKPYLEALRSVGIDARGHSVESEARLDGISGLVLMGGTDVNPARYGESAAPETDEPDEQRDEIEFRVTAQALERDLPVLAICRGMQLLNVLLKGTLIQHLGSVRHDPKFNDRAKPAHEVEVRPDSLLARCVGKNRVWVNSRHHQAVSKVGEGLRVCGRDRESGVVEAIEYEGKRYVLGVQWHPEDQVASDPLQRRLFQSFADALLLP
jgi:gamma-glutamyl-gamma-aminobutyrate hydrolase PuuD